jgi:DNA ligase 1
MNFDPKRKLMLAAEVKTFEELPESHYRVSLKLDGIRAYVALSPEGKPVVYSRTHKPIPNLQVQDRFGRVSLLGLEGELGLKESSQFSSVQSVVMSRDKVDDTLCFNAFPWCVVEKNNALRVYGVFYLVEELVAREDIRAKWKDMQSCRSYPIEGLMFRRACLDPKEPYKEGRSTLKEGCLIKWKAKKSSEYTLVGVEEARDKHGYPKGELGALVLRDHPADPPFKVGTGFSSAQRKELWATQETLKGKPVEVEYMNLHESGIPRHPVFKGFRDE